MIHSPVGCVSAVFHLVGKLKGLGEKGLDMIILRNSPKMTKGTVTHSDGNIVIITMIGAEPMRIHRDRSKTEEQFKAEWPVAREVTMEVKQ